MIKSLCQIYYFDFINDNKHSSIKPHKHPFWQIEILLSGEISFSIENKVRKVVAPSVIFIPPNVTHGFEYNFKFINVISLKFQVESKQKDCQVSIQTIQHPLNFIAEAVEFEIVKNSIPNKKLLEGLIYTMWDNFYIHISKSHTDSLNEKIKSFVESKKGGRVTISDIAEKLDLSTSRISSYFKKNNPITLKEFIDERRLYFCKTLLLYSEYNISEIATKLDFKDLYSLSHFFKKMTKLSPSEFKNKGHL